MKHRKKRNKRSVPHDDSEKRFLDCEKGLKCCEDEGEDETLKAAGETLTLAKSYIYTHLFIVFIVVLRKYYPLLLILPKCPQTECLCFVPVF